MVLRRIPVYGTDLSEGFSLSSVVVYLPRTLWFACSFLFVIFMFLQVYSNFFVIISGKSSCPIFVSLHIIFVMYELNPDCYLSMVVKLELFATTSSDVHTRCVMLLSHLIPWATFPTHELRFFLIYYCHIHAYG